MSADVPRKVLWAANVRTKPLDERLRAACEHGFDAISIFPIDYRTWRNAGWTDDRLARAVADAGLAVVSIDPFTQWTPDWVPPTNYPPESLAFVDFDESAVFHMAEVFSAEAVNCVEAFGATYTVAQLTDALGGLADRAAARKLRLMLEFMPISGIKNLADGWPPIAAANRPNLGLVFDVWHFLRSDADLEMLETVPGDRIFEVQLADGLKTPISDLMNDLLHHRLAPGAGELSVAQTVAALKKIGGFRSVGPEVFSDAFDALSGSAAAQAGAEALDRFLDTEPEQVGPSGRTSTEARDAIR